MKILEGKEQEYQDWKAKNTDGYGAGIFAYAESWAELMEARIDAGEKIADVAEETSHNAEPKGITGYMYGASVGVLSLCWEHGEELRQWHNLDAQIGDEGEKANKEGGVLNPALLNISIKK